ncbi:MAG: ribosome biogenesis GTP-binding protein YihA/YsxC [Alphaproteobacteria bacterium]|nr:ribosome biogenesis GTP-binding protein YihA/YsxC [Alphaproteobacteria bacterium]
MRVEFLGSFPDAAMMPDTGLGEVAFIGRSNVGKSSLLNAIAGQAVARVSQTPGRTQMINMFRLDGKTVLVDLPGYGYAKASKADVAAWQDMMRGYLGARAALRQVLLLIDSRHGAKQIDLDFMAALDKSAVAYALVLTKIDKIKDPDAVVKAAEALAAKHPACFPSVFATSAEKKMGIKEVRDLATGK